MFNIFKNWKNQQNVVFNLEWYIKEDILKGEIFVYIVIIMDGNGCWVKKCLFLWIVGYYEGMKVVKRVIKFVNQFGVKVLIFYVFFMENWKCLKMEVDFLMKFLEEFLNMYFFELIEENVCVKIIGDEFVFFFYMYKVIEKVVKDIE